MNAISARVMDKLTESAEEPPQPKRRRLAETEPCTSRPWADRRDSGRDQLLPCFQDSDDESKSDEETRSTSGFSLSGDSEALVKCAFSSTI